EDKKRWLINSIKNYNKDPKRVKEVIAFVKDSGGLQYAETKMLAYRDEAMQILTSFPNSEYRESLELLLDYVIERKQ
ncbi:hypothetical protein RZS08_13620, partial [Arthrospira platensis SPKY1]|nr:hypothetical protein [Arthrospira platensis SPKY1]